MTRNARFWVWDGDYLSPVKLTLAPGQSLHTSIGGPTDEGWSRTTHVYSFDGVDVTHEWHRSSRDCDGRYEQGGRSTCPLHRLASGGAPAPSYGDVRWPEWRDEGRNYRDYAAEAAGY